jgi:TRAP-type C4-dicarboxylate transport system permease small subunit
LNDGSQRSWSARISRAGRVLEDSLIVLLLGGLILFSSAQILLRNVFSVGFTWSDGLIRLAVLWLALLGALAASRDGKHISMGALVQWLPRRYKIAAEVVADLFAALVTAALAYFAFSFVRDSRTFGDTLLGNLPAWWFQSIMPIAFALIAYRYVVQAVRRLRGA